MTVSEHPAVDLLKPEVVKRHFEAQQEEVWAIPTPLETWNRHCRDEGGGQGLAYGWHVTVAGATGKGKSLMGLNLGARALDNGVGVGFVSFEMSRAQLATRLYAIATQVPVRRLERGDDFSVEAARKAAEKIAEVSPHASFHTNDAPLRDIHDGLELMQRWKEDHYVRLFIVDYLQLAAAWDAENEYRAVSNVSRLVRQFAVENDAVTVGLSQLNRKVAGERSESPIVEGLKSTSSLEHDSDQVLLLDHSRYAKTPGRKRARTYALLAKNRHGASGEIPIEWNYSTLRVREGLDDELHEWPGGL